MENAYISIVLKPKIEAEKTVNFPKLPCFPMKLTIKINTEGLWCFSRRHPGKERKS